MADVSGKFFSAVKVRTGVSPSSPGTLEGETLEPVNPPGGGLNSVGVTMPSAFAVANSPLTSNGTIQITGAGTIAQYVRGDGTLETFPSLTGFVPYTGATQNVDLGEFGVDAGFVTLDTTPTNTPTSQGTIFWDADDNTVDVVLNGYIMKIGEDLFYPVKNQTGSSIAKGTAVRFAGTVGASGRLLIAPFIADGSVSSSFFMGVTAEAIADGADGKVLYFGRIRGINTNAFNEGDVLYASTTVAGGFQTAVPLAPNNIVQVAAVINKSINQGVIFIRPSFGSNINQDEGVKIVSPTTGQLLQLQANGLWENKTTAQVLGGTSSQFVKGDGTLDSNTYQVTSEKGEPNGYASLDSNGKVPLVQINDALIGNVNFQGLWNASTNTPTLANPPASDTKGHYYIVSTAGTFAGISFEVGDWIISDGTAWGKVDNTDAVSSVFGRTGNVTAANGDYTTAQVTESGNLYYTDGRARGALSFVAGSGAYNSTTGVITIPTNNNQITNGAGYITSAALSGYLPLTGGTLTGPLGGTSATFNSTIQAGKLVSAADANQGILDFGTSSLRGIVSYSAATGLWSFNNQTSTSNSTLPYFQFQADSSPIITMLKNGAFGIGTINPARQFVLSNGGANGLEITTVSSGSVYEIITYNRSTSAYTPLQFESSVYTFNRGNVLVGTTSDAGFKLDVNGTGRFKIDGSSKFGLDILNNAGSRGAGFYNTGSNNVQLYFYNSAGTEKIFLDGGTGAATFAGPLNGTSASFITSATNIATFKTTSNNYSSLFLRMDNASESTSRNWGIFSDFGNYGELRIAPSSTNTGDPDASLAALRIASTGAATFSSLSGSGNRIVVANSGGTLISAVIGSGLAFDGTTLTATGGSSGSISGSGDSGTIALFTGSTSIGNSVITQSSGNVGINISSPFSKLHVRNSDTNEGTIAVGHQIYPGLIFSSANTGEFRIDNRSSAGGGFITFYPNGQQNTLGNEAMRIANSRNVLIGTTSDNGNRLRVNGTIFSDSSVTATSFFESSDATIKTLVEDSYQAKGIDSVVAKLYIKNGKQELGYYAQDLEGVLPSAVSKGSNGLLNLSYREVHTAKIAYLEQQIKELRNELVKPS